MWYQREKKIYIKVVIYGYLKKKEISNIIYEIKLKYNLNK